MRRNCFFILYLALILCSILPTTVNAEVRKPGRHDSVVTAPSTGDSSIQQGVVTEPFHPSYTVYTPKVTSLRSVNALLAENGYAVFFLPTLSDFPVNLKDTVTDLTDGNNERHQFALVYDGYFDSGVLLQNASNLGTTDVSSAKTSKKVYEQSNNSRCLNMLGYDMLLVKEQIPVSVSGGDLVFDYIIQTVGNQRLHAETCVMDLYKAMGVYEYDIRFAYGIDPDFEANSSPILQELSVLTSREATDGLDATEAITWVAATRTNPDQYWDRCTRDAIFDGGQHKVAKADNSSNAYVGTEVSMSKVLNRNDSVKLGEFCEMARAIMTLYGEPVLTEQERNAALQLYGIELPKGSLDEEEYDSVMWLAAKGIIDPTNLNFNKYVTFDDIEMILLRIADEGSRLTIKSSVNMSTTLTAAGYATTGVMVSEDMDYQILDGRESDWYDFLIRKYDVNTYVVKDNSGVQNPVSQTPEGGTTGFRTGSGKYNSNTFPSVSGVGLLTNGNYLKANDLYNFYGLQEYDGDLYYHFKVNMRNTYSQIPKITMGYDTTNSDFTLVSGSAVTMPDNYGGVYTMKNGKWVRESFTSANFTTEFVDKDNYKGNLSKKLADQTVIVAVTVPGGFLKEAVLKNYQRDGSDHSLDFSKLMNEGKMKESGSVSKKVSFNTFEFSSEDDDYIRIEFTTPDKKIITQSNFFKYLASEDDRAKIRTCQGYYRASDNSLLVSYNYLKEKGLVSGLEKLNDDSGYTLVAGEYNTNVTLFTKDNTNYIMVGDTIFGNPEGETLIEVGENDTYINYRACLGWASDYIVVPVGDGNVMALTPKDFGNGDKAWNVTKSTETITSFFPKSSVNTLRLLVRKGSDTKGNGIAMTGSYALSPYCIVMANDNGCDYLFVWHQKGVTIGTEEHEEDENMQKTEQEAREMFKRWTGLEVSENSSYALKMLTLKRKNSDNQVPGFKYVSMKKKTKTMGTQSATYGYVYKPPKYDNVNTALQDYARGLYTERDKNVKMPLPFFEYNGVIYDANINTCSDSTGNPQLRLGMMPGRFCSKTWQETDQVVYLDDTGAQRMTRSSDYDTDTFVVYTAPVAMFAVLKCNGTKPVSEIKDGAIYFGTSRVKIVDDKVVSTTGCETSYGIDDEAICTYIGVGKTSVYAVCDGNGNAFSSIGEILKKAESAVSSAFEDPSSVVDWEQFKFNRLIANLDAWSTVVMIFVLNILPRVGVLLFFILMLLCCIKNVRFWQIFCERVFDVYSFLTFKHMDVHTINVKKVCMISLVCTALFIMIMDGQLFNFMIWVSRLFIAYTQR